MKKLLLILALSVVGCSATSSEYDLANYKYYRVGEWIGVGESATTNYSSYSYTSKVVEASTTYLKIVDTSVGLTDTSAITNVARTYSKPADFPVLDIVTMTSSNDVTGVFSSSSVITKYIGD